MEGGWGDEVVGRRKVSMAGNKERVADESGLEAQKQRHEVNIARF